MDVPKKKIIRVKTKEEVLQQQQQQQKLAPMFCKTAPSAPKAPVNTPIIKSVKHSSTVEEFLKTLDEKELIAYNIAKSHLGLLFSLERSNCYLEWLERMTLGKNDA